MSPRFQCSSCDGEYSDPDADGMRYFHACPPDRVTGPGRREPIANPRDERPDFTKLRTNKGDVDVSIDARERPKPLDPDSPSPPLREGAGRVSIPDPEP